MKSVLVRKASSITYWVECIEETLEEKLFMDGKVSQGDAMDDLLYLRSLERTTKKELDSFNYSTPKYKVKDYENYLKAIKKMIKKYEKKIYNI